VLSTWIVATLASQFNHPWSRQLALHDPLRLLPRWTFFAPRPGTTDYSIIYREIGEDDSPAQFVELVIPTRTLRSALFNPYKRQRKTLHDLANSLGRLQLSDQWNSQTIYMSLPYIALLNFLSSQPGAKGGRIQFCLMATQGRSDSNPPHVVLKSAIHRV
jgi:hypothetical protein